MAYRYALKMVFCMAALISEAVWSQTTFKFASIAGLAEQEIAAKMLVPVFESAGYGLEVEPMPAERARVEANEGRKDGDLLRIFSYGERNPTMIRVPTPYSTVETTAFALKSKNISIKTKDDLKQYRLAIVRGVMTTRDLTQGMPNVSELSSLEQAIKVIQSGREEVLLTSDIGGISMLKKLGITEIVKVGDISSLPLYVYFNPKNKDAVDKIDLAIQEKIRNGVLKGLRSKYEKEYIDSIKQD